MLASFIPYAVGLGVLALAVLAFFVLAIFRRVVATNEVHIVQSSKRTTSYGKEHGSNSYYHWPAWIPYFGVTVIQLPVSVFDQNLDSYEAYDKGRLPFMLDVKAFFRIEKSDLAAQRVSSFLELKEQLKAILQGAIRTILASVDIETIMQDRSVFGEKFTNEVNQQLTEWGVTTVKSIELMDIRDSQGSKVIQNIMEKDKSRIEKESRVAVAANHQVANIAEIAAKRETELMQQEAEQQVGIRTAQAAQKIGIAQEQANQAVQVEAKTTAEKQMDVVRVQEVRKAEIAKDVQVVKATQDKEVAVVGAEAEKETTMRVAEGQLAATKNESEGVKALGEAKAEAEKAMQLAPVQAQIVLAKEIGDNQGYQTYLISVRTIEKEQAVGIAQADALKSADLKVIANSGTVTNGISSIGDVFSSTGGTAVGSMLEGLANTEQGKALLGKFLAPKSE